MPGKQKIIPFLWYDGQAEEAVNLYVSIFKDSKILSVTRCGDAGPGPKGSVLTISFNSKVEEFAALNGGPAFKFNEAVSLLVGCTTQKEIDRLWSKLTADGGQESACGWIKDKFGLSWQITPTVLLKMIRDKDPKKSARVMKAMMEMGKLDLAKLEKAYGAKKAAAKSKRPK